MIVKGLIVTIMKNNKIKVCENYILSDYAVSYFLCFDKHGDKK
jgi:hypothetical protein